MLSGGAYRHTFCRGASGSYVVWSVARQQGSMKSKRQGAAHLLSDLSSADSRSSDHDHGNVPSINMCRSLTLETLSGSLASRSCNFTSSTVKAAHSEL